MASITAVSDPSTPYPVASFAAPSDLCSELDFLMELACRKQRRGVLDKDVADPSLLSRLGYVQLQISDLDGAKRRTFSRAESLGKWEPGDADMEFENL